MIKKKIEKKLDIFDKEEILKRNKFFEDLKEGLQEILDYLRLRLNASIDALHLKYSK